VKLQLVVNLHKLKSQEFILLQFASRKMNSNHNNHSAATIAVSAAPQQALQQVS
jgi:hypothetical protein